MVTLPLTASLAVSSLSAQHVLLFPSHPPWDIPGANPSGMQEGKHSPAAYPALAPSSMDPPQGLQQQHEGEQGQAGLEMQKGGEFGSNNEGINSEDAAMAHKVNEILLKKG